MALVKCRECKTEVSTTATKCPKCGAAPTRTHYVGQLMGGLFAIGLLFYLFGGGLDRSVSNDFIKQYNMAKKNGDLMGACVEAGVIAASYLGKDEVNYNRWRKTEAAECGAAGVPNSLMNGPASAGSAPEAATDVLSAVEQDVAKDAVAQYEIAKRSGNLMQMCVQASTVVQAFLQAKDETNFKMWGKVKKHDCAKAGLPIP